MGVTMAGSVVALGVALVAMAAVGMVIVSVM
jgi:hypothetical protein